jgi:spermidine synthase
MAPSEDKQFMEAAPVTTHDEGVSPAGSNPLSNSPKLLACLVVMFATSGCAALIYEIVWFQMLQLVIGSTAVSIAVLLASFMGGMCLGSLVLPRYLTPSANPLRAVALFELGIGAFGIGIVFAVPWLAKFYAGIAPSGVAGLLIRGSLCAVCLLPPTLLMGATLPVIARLGEATPKGASHIGLIYGANTLGAVAGALLAGFYVLRVADVFTATFVAAAINLAVACIGLSLSGRLSNYKTGAPSHLRDRCAPNWQIYVTIALSGLCALAAEVIWTRLLSLMLGGTTYTFSIILAVFLFGLGIGSGTGAFLARRVPRPVVALGICQLLVAAAVAWTAFMVEKWLPYWPINPALARSVWLVFELDVLRCLWAILPAACFWGASFPLALAATAATEQEPGRLVGRLYAANTVGAIVGAVGTSIFLIAFVGTQQAQRLLIVLSVVAGFLVLPKPLMVKAGGGKSSFSRAAIWAGLSGAAALLLWSVPRVPWPLVAYGRYLPMETAEADMLYMGEGMNASVAITELANGVRNFHISGKIEASSDKQDMRVQRMLGHLPALFHPEPGSALVVGCGAGVTAGSFLTHPSIERITICEIERLIPTVVASYFGEENHDVIHDPRVRLVYDDARHYILTTRDKFDIITSDPIHPWVKGAAILYTKDYFELCKQHLNPGGMITQWVPLYESNLAAVRSEIATFLEVFPDGTLWSNDHLGSGYDLVLLGQEGPLEVDVGALQRRLNRGDHRQVARSLHETGIRSAFSLAATYAGQAQDLKPWLKPARINHDRDLRLQYLAGLGLNLNESESIYAEIIDYRRFPQEIFVGSNFWTDGLRREFMRPDAPSSAQSKDSGVSKNHLPETGTTTTNRPHSGNSLSKASPP